MENTKPILECVAGDSVRNRDGSRAYTFAETPYRAKDVRTFSAIARAIVEWSDGGRETREWPIGAAVPIYSRQTDCDCGGKVPHVRAGGYVCPVAFHNDGGNV